MANMIEIQRKAAGGTYATIDTKPLSDGTYDDTNEDLITGITYYYRARKVIDDVPYDWSNESYVTYTGPVGPLLGSTTPAASIIGILNAQPALVGLIPAQSDLDSILYVVIYYTGSISAISSLSGIVSPIMAISTLCAATSTCSAAAVYPKYIVLHTPLNFSHMKTDKGEEAITGIITVTGKRILYYMITDIGEYINTKISMSPRNLPSMLIRTYIHSRLRSIAT